MQRHHLYNHLFLFLKICWNESVRVASLLSRATVIEAYYFLWRDDRIWFNCGNGAKCLRKIERTGGELTEALQKTFPPDHLLDANSNTHTDDEPDIGGDNDDIYFAGGTDDDDDDHRF